jgi:hypothetical protein
MDFRGSDIFRVEKADNIANFAPGGIINRRTHQNSVCRDRQEQTLVASYMMVYKALSHVTLPRRREPFPIPTLVV